MIESTFSLDNFLIGLGMLIFLFVIIDFIGKKINQEHKVKYTKWNIHTNALWDYWNRNEKEEDYKPEFEELLEEETINHFFPKTKGKK